MRTRTRAAIFIPIFLLIASACGSNAKQKALQTTLTGLNVARDGFIAWDYTHQQGIVEKATSLEDGKAKLKTYRTKREKAVLAFEIAYRALAVAALEPTLANLGAAIQNATALYTLVRQMMGKDTPKLPDLPKEVPK